MREGLVDILFDAQTSGGLLISLPKGKVELLCTKLREKGVMTAEIIGEVHKRRDVSIIVTP